MHGYAAVVPRVIPRMSIPVLHGLYGNFSHIVVYDAEPPELNDIVCDLCTNWEVSDDSTTYTFHLRENAQWQDGMPVTARDVYYSIDSMMDPTQYPILVESAVSVSHTEFVFPFYVDVGSYRVIDDHTFEMTTKFPTPLLLQALGNNNNIIVAAHKVLDEEIVQGTVDPENLVTSGPFLLDSFDREIVWKSRRNPNYYRDGYPRIDGIDSFIITDKGAAIAAYKTEQVLMGNAALTNLNITEMERLADEERDRLNVHFAGPRGMHGIVINTTRAPFDNVKVRQALHLAVYRQGVIGVAGGAHLIGTPLPPDTPWSRSLEEIAMLPGYRETEEGQKSSEDIDAAKALLEAAGLGGKLQIQVTARNCCNYPEEATVIADQLRRFLGWDTDVRVMESAAGFDAYAAGDTQIFVQGSGLSLLDPDAYFDRYLAINYFAKVAIGQFPAEIGFSIPDVNELWAQQQQELDLEKRKALVRQAEDILLEVDNIYVPLYWETGAWVVNKKIQGFNMHPLIYVYIKHDQIWCDPAC